MTRAQRTRSLAKPRAYQQSRWYFTKGYSDKAIAAALHVHRNTVHRWRLLHEQYATRSDAAGTPSEVRTINAALRLAKRLPPAAKRQLVDMLAATLQAQAHD